MTIETLQALYEAIDKCGNVAGFATAMSDHGHATSRFQVYRWIRNEECPPTMARPIEAVTGVHRGRLRPDLYDPPPPDDDDASLDEAGVT